MKYCILIFVLIFHIYPSWAREPLLTDVLNKDINITASFDGAKIVIYGAIDTKLHKDSILLLIISIILLSFLISIEDVGLNRIIKYNKYNNALIVKIFGISFNTLISIDCINF